VRHKFREIGSLVGMLRFRAETQGYSCAYRFIGQGAAHEQTVSWGSLDAEAQRIATILQRLGLAYQRVVLVFPAGIEFLCAFFGSLYAGCVAVPVVPPAAKRGVDHLCSIARVCKPAVVLAATTFRFEVQEWSQTPELRGVQFVTPEEWRTADIAWQMPKITSGSLALLQFTSGSTGNPKGVTISHGNIIENQKAICRAFAHSQESIVVGWLPHYHDMGLIGNFLQPLYAGIPCIFMSAVAFVHCPILWLQAIDRFRATTSGAPNFAYDLCVRRISEKETRGLDLSSWNLAFCGAERVKPKTLESFATKFGVYGFRREAFYPCYGLAEATLFVAGGTKGTGPVIRSYDTSALQQGKAMELPTGTAGAASIVSCGTPLGVRRAIIVDPESCEPRKAREVGELWLSGPSVADGYWGSVQNPGVSFDGSLANETGKWLRTGDLAFMDHGEIHPVGRIKELIVVRGRNHHPQDIEQSAESCHAAICPNRLAAFAIDVDHEERLVLALEVQPNTADAESGLIVEQVRKSIVEGHGIPVHAVVILPRGTLPITSSGKLRRSECRELFLSWRKKAFDEMSLRKVQTDSVRNDFIPCKIQVSCL
jgi:acyl-CoA synthetase (AMP-forming)/AMP-acid ligase II